MARVVRSLLSAALAALALPLVACGADDSPAQDTPDADTPADVDAAPPGEPDAAAEAPDAAPPTPDAAPPTLWAADFSAQATDPAADDTGDGDYTYPADVPAGSLDLRGFDLAYTAATGELAVGVELAAIAPGTRVGVMLLDSTAFAAGDRDWTIGGNELRVPLWNGHGVSFLLAQPEDNPLLDWAVQNQNPSGNPRPDNATYLKSGPVEMLASEGGATQIVELAARLDVTQSQVASGVRLAFTVNAAALAPFLDTESATLYAIVFTYALVPGPAMEYGAYDVGVAEGASASWEDADVYDIGFVDAPAEQAALLTVAGTGVGAVVVLDEPGQGLLAIPTAATP